MLNFILFALLTLSAKDFKNEAVIGTNKKLATHIAYKISSYGGG